MKKPFSWFRSLGVAWLPWGRSLSVTLLSSVRLVPNGSSQHRPASCTTFLVSLLNNKLRLCISCADIYSHFNTSVIFVDLSFVLLQSKRKMVERQINNIVSSLSVPFCYYSQLKSCTQAIYLQILSHKQGICICLCIM